MIKFNSPITTNFESASSREWLETNGIGGFACGTIAGANTRRYHGILTAAAHPPLGRVTMLSKFEETLIVDGNRFELSANQFSGGVQPRGFQYLREFRLDPFPVWIYEAGGVTIEKTVFMPHGTNAAVCEWRILEKNQSSVLLELRPLLSFVDYHALQHEDRDFNAEYTVEENLLKIDPYQNLPPLYLAHNAAAIEKTGYWYKDFEYAIERERGFDFREDLFQPLALTFDLEKPATVIASTTLVKSAEAEKLRKAEITRREKLIKTAGADGDFARQLVLAADQFIVARGAGQTVIAGYPWFSDWGRDTMIALNGLTLATNRPEIAKNILLEFSRHISEGMIPNRFPDAGENPEYNNVDGTLWYFEAIRAYAEKTGDYKFVLKNLYPKLVEIIVHHIRGTRFQIKMDEDGLLHAGEAGTQLTWMDAKYGETVFTPRIGKPVEVQALWYNALKIMADFARRNGDLKDQEIYQSTAQAAKQSFNLVFWNDREECLYDVIDHDRHDGSIRPNQIFAVSLFYPIVDEPEKARRIVQKIEKELLTPVGLRSLTPLDAQYAPHYGGSPYQRDSAYHQGTVWAWLIGGFIDAHRKFFPEQEDKITQIFHAFEKHLTEAGIGQISEIFDANQPHTPRGCFAQAWSVAEVLRVLKEGSR